MARAFRDPLPRLAWPTPYSERMIRAVMFFAESPKTVAAWWAKVLDADLHVDGTFAFFEADGVEWGFHPADPERNSIGGSPVVYLSTHSFDADLERFLASGCRLHRGPLQIGPERSICQLVDPFGNTFGLDGL